MMHIVAYTSNGMAVYAELIHSAAAVSISRQPHLLTLAAEALPHITIEGTEGVIEYDMGRTIGYDFVILTPTTDAIFYAKQIKEDAYTRFIKYGQPCASSFLTVHLQQNDKGTGYLLQDVRIGHVVPPLPGHTDETGLSRPYWAEHAIIFDNQPLQASTLTKNCPY